MRLSMLASALGIGALSTYFFDADRGRERRAMLKDKLRSARHQARGFAAEAKRDASARAYGLFAGVRSRLSESHIPPAQLAERVRSRVGRAASNAGAIDVHVEADGAVVLSGPLLRGEQNRLLATVWSTPGVVRVENNLELHDRVGNTPELQGARPHHAGRRSWPASVRLLAGVAGATATLYGSVRGGGRGLLALAAGGALLARSTRNESLAGIVGIGTSSSVHLDKEFFIAAPPERVLDCWRAPDQFPRFMQNVLDVRPLGDGRWHWKISGPGGRAVEWDAQVFERDEGRRIHWHALPGSFVQHHGRVDIEPEREGTRLRVAMDYVPAAGVLGDSIARLFGKDAKTILDEDLVRLKTFLETGNVPRDAARSQRPAEAVESLH